MYSLGKIVMSPRYAQYPDLSDDDSPNVGNHQPLSLPHLRPGCCDHQDEEEKEHDGDDKELDNDDIHDDNSE